MKTKIQIFILVSFCSALFGCGGSAIKGIADRELESPTLPHSLDLNKKALNYFINGSIFEVMGEISMASSQYKEALKYYPDSREIRYAYASTLMKLHDFGRAIAEAKKISPKDVNTRLLIANCYRALGMRDSAVILYREVIETDSTNLQALYHIATDYEQAGELDSAIRAFENIARVSPTYNVYLRLGNLQIRAGHLEEAEKNYFQSLAYDSTENNVGSFLGLSAIFEDRGDKEKAGQFLESAARRAPQDLGIQNRLLGFYHVNKDYNRAIETALTIQSISPNDTGAARRLALIYYEADSLRQADSILSGLIEGGDENVVNYYYSGRIAFENENYDHAKRLFTRLTALADSVVDGWLNLGLIYRIQDSAALEAATYESGIPYMKNQEDSARLLFVTAAALEQQGEFDRAVSIFEQLIELQPDNSQALNYLGYMLADKGIRLDYARSLIEKALKIMPENGAYIDSYGWVLHRLGENRKALAELLRASQYEENDPVIIEHVGDVYEAVGDMENAFQYWNKALEMNPDNEALKEKLKK